MMISLIRVIYHPIPPPSFEQNHIWPVVMTRGSLSPSSPHHFSSSQNIVRFGCSFGNCLGGSLECFESAIVHSTTHFKWTALTFIH